MPPLHPGLLAAALCAAAWCPAVVVAQTADSNTSAPTGTYDSAAEPSAGLTGLPDSPGVLWAKSQSPAQQSAEAQSITPQSDQNADADKDKKNAEKLQRPVGTAAAEAPKVSGVTAAQPAGAAIAPAKQHRVRTIVLKVGAILGAGAAVGTVVALSAATPSKPPGAH
jgi:hypothetical protein